VFRWLLSLLGFSRKADVAPIQEEEAYAHSYGDRGGDILTVERMPESEPEPAPGTRDDLTGEYLRRAFERKLDERKKLTT
jgi:hypothetical protein